VRVTELGNDGRDYRPRRLVFAARFADHTHGALDESRRGLGCFFTAPISQTMELLQDPGHFTPRSIHKIHTPTSKIPPPVSSKSRYLNQTRMT
jgi:hypothetical protein